MTRIVVGGDGLAGFAIPAPAASVRLLIPEDEALVIPEWQGNEFRYADGSRPIIRTLTPRRFDAERLLLDLDIVIHEGGAVSEWAALGEIGRPAAVSGPGRGYDIDPSVKRFFLIGDETAIPAICQLLEWLGEVDIVTHIDVRFPDARVDLHREVDEHWHVSSPREGIGRGVFAALDEVDLRPDDRIWAAGEAGAMRRLRQYLFDVRGLDRTAASVRGYWKER